MGFASALHSSIRAPLKSDLTRLKLAPVKWARLQFTQPHAPALRGGCRGRYLYPILSAKGADPVNESEETEKIGFTTERDDGLKASSSLEHGDSTTSLKTVALCVGSAVAFGIGVGFIEGVGKASEFFAGYLLEQSLSVDNLFVFVLVFKYFKVPLMYQNRVLSYGIAGAIIFRLALILLGTATLQRFEAVNLLLAAVLLFSSFKLFTSEDDETDLSDNFIVKTCQRFIPVTSTYDGNRFFTWEDGIRKASTILDRLHLYSLR